MITVIEHKNHIRRVRDDWAAEYVACVPCKGTGERRICIGHMGSLYYYGWEMYAYQGRACFECGGAGIWRAASFPSTESSKP